MIHNENSTARIEVIDGFRCIAVLAVILYHYFCRFSPPVSPVNYLPYQYDPWLVIQYGYFGVQLFFVISGFVIFHTLQRCDSFREFIIRRLIRLMPALLICSLISFLIVQVLYHQPPFEKPSTWLDFIPSLTFIPPYVWNGIFGRADITYVDGVYWSLTVEVMFYLVAGLLFFRRPEKFFPTWVRITFVLTVVRIICSPKLYFLFPEGVDQVLNVVYSTYLKLGLQYWVYFALGMFFYSLYAKQGTVKRIEVILIGLLSLTEIYFLKENMLRIFFVASIGLFALFIYREKYLSILTKKFFIWVGAISYPLYLLHQNIGLVLINRMAMAVDFHPLGRYLPWVVIAIMMIASYCIFRFIEKPAMKFLRSRFTFHKTSSNNAVPVK